MSVEVVRDVLEQFEMTPEVTLDATTGEVRSMEMAREKGQYHCHLLRGIQFLA